MTAPGVLDLKASRCCMLTLVDAAAPSKVDDPAEWDRWVTHVVLPGTATVNVDGHTVVIPEGEHRWVRSTSMTYSMTPPGTAS